MFCLINTSRGTLRCYYFSSIKACYFTLAFFPSYESFENGAVINTTSFVRTLRIARQVTIKNADSFQGLIYAHIAMQALCGVIIVKHSANCWKATGEKSSEWTLNTKSFGNDRSMTNAVWISTARVRSRQITKVFFWITWEDTLYLNNTKNILLKRFSEAHRRLYNCIRKESTWSQILENIDIWKC